MFRFQGLCSRVIPRYRLISTTMAQDVTEFYVCLPDNPAYLKPVRSSKNSTGDGSNTKDGQTGYQNSALAPYSTLFTFDIPELKKHNDVNKGAHAYVRSCLSLQRIYRHICEIPELAKNVEFVLGAKTQQGCLLRQLFAFVADDAKEEHAEVYSAVKLHAKESDANVNVLMYKKEPKASSESTQWTLKTPEAVNEVPGVLEEALQEVSLPSPIFSDEKYSPVFHDQDRAIQVLDMYSECTEVSRLKEIARTELTGQKSVPELAAMMRHPLVVVEGMDATGKTTLTQFLENKLQAARYSTPPPCLLDLRPFFDKLPEIVRRAYYSLGNYIVAQQIAKECQERPVVMDRYWHSTAAYGIANETSMSDLPLSGHSVYAWPSDLLRPTAVVFLRVSEDVRRQRLGHRHTKEITFEERRMNKDRIFRQRLCEAYLRMREPACVEVDASGTEKEVVDLVLKQLQQQGIHLT